LLTKEQDLGDYQTMKRRSILALRLILRWTRHLVGWSLWLAITVRIMI